MGPNRGRVDRRGSKNEKTIRPNDPGCHETKHKPAQPLIVRRVRKLHCIDYITSVPLPCESWSFRWQE